MKKLVQRVCMLVVLMITATYGLSAQDVLNETFENGFEPNGWTQLPANATVPWTIGSSGVGNVTPYQGNNMVKLYSGSRQDSVRLISKSLDATGILEPTLDFYIASPKFGAAESGDSLKIYVKVGETWKHVMSYATNSAEWQKKSIRIKDHIENPTNFQIAFEWVYGNGKGIALDNIMVYGSNACTTPANLRTRNVTGETASLVWNTGQYTTSNRIKVFTSPVADASQIETAQALIDDTSQFSIFEATGLTPETSYYWYVKSTCSAADISEWSSVGQLKTLCATQALPSGIDNFDSYTANAMPTCWNYVVDLVGEWSEGTSAVRYAPRVVTSQSSDQVEGGKSLSISSVHEDGKSTVAYAVSPRTNVTSMKTYQLKFKLRSPSVVHKLSVGTMTDAHVQSSFVEAAEVSVALPNTWQDVTVYLLTAANNAQFFAFKVDGSDTQDDTFFIDELEISEIPECATPIYIRVSEITRTGAKLSWSSNAASFDIKLYQTLSNPATDTPVASAQNVTSPHNITGLQPSSQYVAYIKRACNEEWSQPFIFRTEQEAASLPFYDDFESNLTSWDLSNENQPNKWHIGTAVNNGGNKSLYISDDNGVSNHYDASKASAVYAKRLLSLTAGTEYSLYLDWKGVGLQSPYSTTDGARAYLVPAALNSTIESGKRPMQSWITLGNWLAGQSIWQSLEQEGITVPTTGEYYLVLCWANNITDGGQPPIAIDNVRFSELKCGVAKKVILKDITDNSATIVWSPATKGTPTQYSIYVVDQGADHTTVTPQTTADTTITITGLQPSKRYDVYIITNCSSAEGNSEPVVIKLLSNQTVSTIPYSEDFEGETSTFYLENGDQTNKWTVGTADHNGTGSKSMYISKDGNAREYDKTKRAFAYAYTTFNLSNGEKYDLKFDWKSYGKDKADILNVFLVPDDMRTVVAQNANGMDGLLNNTPADWTKLTDDILFSDTTDWQTLETTFNVATSGRYKLVFFWKNTSSDGNESGAGAIDNVLLNLNPCPSVNSIRTETVGNSLNISWVASTSASSWDIAVVPTDSTPTAFTNVTTPSYSLSPFAPNTVYDVYVYSKCSGTTVSDTTKHIAKTTPVIPFSEDFENENYDNFWTMSASSSGVNKWTIGGGAGNGGGRSMYVSSNDYIYEYLIISSSVSYAHILFDFEQGAEYSVKYDWKGMGESQYDYLRVFIIPESYTAEIINGNGFGISYNNNLPTNWVAISGTQLNNSEDWSTVDTTFSVNETGKYHLAFFWRNDGSGGINPPAAIDNIELSKVLCRALKNIVVSDISQTDAKISWDASAEAASYDIKVATSKIDPETQSGDIGDYLGLTDSYIDLSGNLTSGTTYYVYIRVNCNNGNSSLYTMVKFSTLCEAKNIPYIDNFESNDTEQKAMPTCWSYYVYKSDADSIAGDFIPFVDSETVGEVENKFINMNVFYKAANGAFSSSFAILPEFVEPINSTMLSFRAKVESDSAKISIGTVSDINDAPTTFVRLGEYKITSEYQNYLVTLDGFSGPANSRIVIVVEGDKLRKTNSVFVDDVRLEALTDCANPTGINHIYVKNDSAILKWTSIYTSARTFQVIVSTEDVGTDFSRLGSLTPAQTAFNQNVTGDSVVVTGLAESTTYYYYIRMVCDNNTYSSWFEDKRTFTTSCLETNKCQLIIKTKAADGKGWSAGDNNYPILGIFGPKDELLGKYKVKQTVSGGLPSDTVNLDTLVVCPGDYAVLYEPTSWLDNTPNSFELILNGTPFYVSERMSNRRFIMNFTIKNGCVGFICTLPDSIKVDAQTTSANIRWTGNADSYDVRVYEYSDSVNPKDTSQIPIFSQNGITATSVDATGLSPQTNYVVFVRSICTNSGEAKNTVWTGLRFTTKIHFELETLPFATGFEDNADNAKWRVSSSRNTRWIIDTMAPKQGTKSIYISKSGNDYSYDARESYSYAARKFSMSAEETYMIDFDWKCEGDTYYDLARAILIPSSAEADILNGNPNGMTWNSNTMPRGWIAVSDLLSESEEWKHSKSLAIVPTDGEYIFALFWKDNGTQPNNPPASIDNISIAALECAPPRNLTVSSATPTSVGLTWGGTADKYTVRVYQTNRDTIDPDVHTNFVNEIPNITTTSTNLTGLIANTDYYLFVRSICGTENSFWSKIQLRTITDVFEAALPFATDFEDNADNAKWGFSDKQVNRWTIGDGASNGGAMAMYITKDTVAPFANQYNPDAESHTYAFRKVELSANDVYSISFDWLSEGDVNNDYGRAFLVPISYYTSIATGKNNGMISGNSNAPEDWIDIGGTTTIRPIGILAGQDTWQSIVKEDIMVPTTGSYLLTFFWKNNDYMVWQPPLAIDNLSFSKVDCPKVFEQVILKKEGNSIVATWSGINTSYLVKLYSYVENFDIETATPIQQATVTTTTHTFGTITDEGIYLVSVQGNCGTTISERKIAYIPFMEKEMLPISTDFQNRLDNLKWKYSNNGSVNQWVIGEAIGNEDTKSLYISQDNGVTHSYKTKIDAASPAITFAYAYRTVSLEASKSYAAKFFWQANGEESLDVLRAFVIPASADIANGNNNGLDGSDNRTPTGWIDIANPGGPLCERSDWTESEKIGITVPNDGNYHLAFFWKNDNIFGDQSPAAIDNFVFKEFETVEVTDNSCLGEPYSRNGFDIPADSLPAAGVYNLTTTYNDPNGKYQEVNLTLTVVDAAVTTKDSTVCAGDEFNFFGKKIVAATSGEYNHYTYSTSTGCDSVVRLNLTVNPSYTIATDVEVTSLPATVGNRTFPAGYPNGEYTVTVPGTTALGCDSTTTYNVVIAVPVGLDGANISGLTIAPNPIEVGQSVEIRSEFSPQELNGLKVEVLNTAGSVLSTVTPKDKPIRIDGFRVSGVYVIRLTTGTGNVVYGKVIVK